MEWLMQQTRLPALPYAETAHYMILYISDEASGSSDFKRTDIEHSIAERGSDHFQFFF